MLLLELLKRFLRWSIWRESKVMSWGHVQIDNFASWVKERNLTVWKQWMLRTLKLYYRLGGAKRRKDEGDD